MDEQPRDEQQDAVAYRTLADDGQGHRVIEVGPRVGGAISFAGERYGSNVRILIVDLYQVTSGHTDDGAGGSVMLSLLNSQPVADEHAQPARPQVMALTLGEMESLVAAWNDFVHDREARAERPDERPDWLRYDEPPF